MVDRVYPVAAVTGAPSYDGRALRQTAVAPFIAGATATRPLGARSGVRPGTPATTVSATSTTWTVQPHAGVIDAESANEAGPYAYAFDAVKTGAMTAANASYARIDLISVQISDPAESDGSSTPSAAIVYTPGTAAAPALPTQPARSMVIAQINVPISGGGGPSVSWVAPYLSAPGGIITVRTQAERDALTLASAERPVYVDRLDTGNIERSVGSGWVVYTGGDTGWQQVPLNTGAGVGPYTTSPYNGLQYRVKAGVCYMTGAVTKSGGFGAGTLIGTLPASARPTIPVDDVNNAGVQYTIKSDGTITAIGAMASTTVLSMIPFPVG